MAGKKNSAQTIVQAELKEALQITRSAQVTAIAGPPRRKNWVTGIRNPEQRLQINTPNSPAPTNSR